jgi:hypothetical protein
LSSGAAVFVPLLLRLEPDLIAELKGFARHGRGAADVREQVPAGKGGRLLAERNASR